MTCDDIGSELWGLVYHLFAKYRETPPLALKELGLRTHREWIDDTGAVRAPQDIKRSAWYADMCAAYQSLRQSLHEKHQRDEADARELMESLYPDGCNVSEYAEAVRTSAALLPCTVPSDVLDQFIQQKGEQFHAHDVHEIRGDELVFDVINELMFRVLLPRQWWCQSKASVAQVRRVGLKAAPPTLFIEYERPRGILHTRRIHLDSYLRENMPTAQLARRLATTHEALLSEEQFQSLLIRCQRLLTAYPASPTLTAGANGSNAGASSAFAAPSPLSPPPAPAEAAALTSSLSTSSQEASTRSTKPQKADLGLLYRDPDAALHNVDLNDADEVTLREFKDVMNERFKAKVVKPGDPGYVYDKRLEVTQPAQPSGWDDDSD